MAQRRFISKSVLETDNFLEMTPTQKLLYIYLVLTSDDDGINNNIRTQLYYANAKESDIEAIKEHNMIIRDSDSKAVCIVHWHIHNAVPTDRYKETDVIGFKNKLFVDEYALITEKKTDIRYLDYKGGSMSNFIKSILTGEKPYKSKKKKSSVEYDETEEAQEDENSFEDSEMSEEVRQNRQKFFEQYDEMTGK